MSIDSALRDAIASAIDGGKTLNQIATEAQVNHAILHRYVHNVRPNIQLATAERLCDYFGLVLKVDSPKPKTTPKPRKK